MHPVSSKADSNANSLALNPKPRAMNTAPNVFLEGRYKFKKLLQLFCQFQVTKEKNHIP